MIRFNYYLENIYDDDYVLEETVGLSGESDKEIEGPIKQYTGFTSPTIIRTLIKADGSTVINYYYKRIRSNVKFVTNGGNVISSKTMKYGEEINDVAIRDSYTFGGWFSNENLTNKITNVGTENVILYAYWSEEVKPSDFSYEIIDNKIKITKYIGNSSTVVIPSRIGDKKVAVIEDNAFKNKTKITSLSLPNGLEQIGEFAFENLSLTELIIPDSVQLIKEGALKGVNGLVSITLPFAGRTRTSQSKVSSYWDDGIDIYKFGYIFGQTRLRGKHLTTENLVYQGDIDGYGFGYYLHYYVPSSLRNITLTDQRKFQRMHFMD
ncbi:MAG: leucine-rich repeat protein [Bacilli bacterium]